MIAVDTNILVYAHREELPQHDRALKRVRELAEGGRAQGDPHMPAEERVRAEGVALHDIGFDRDHRTPNLVEERPSARGERAIRGPERVDQELVCPSPDGERLVLAHAGG